MGFKYAKKTTLAQSSIFKKKKKEYKSKEAWYPTKQLFPSNKTLSYFTSSYKNTFYHFKGWTSEGSEGMV